jgi:hypothetical protein
MVMVDLPVHAGFLVLEGMVLGKEAHREFLRQSGLHEALLAITDSGVDPALEVLRLRFSVRPSTMKGELNRAICDALIGLGSPSVAVVSEGLTTGYLKSIPEVKDAVQEAWLVPEGLKRQLEAASRGDEIPTWPVLNVCGGPSRVGFCFGCTFGAHEGRAVTLIMCWRVRQG